MPHGRSTHDGRARSVPPQVGTEVAGTAPVSAEPEGGYFRPHGPRLVKLGYDPVPIEPGTKRPATKDWLERNFGEERMLRRAFSGHGLGVKTGRPNADGHALIGVDVDVLDPVVAAKLVAWCRKNIGDAPLRVGQAPKAMLVFGTVKPFRKKRSLTFRSLDGREHAVEALGKGQQFLAYAIHPSTGQPYTWHGRELVDVPIAELPKITQQQSLDFIAYFESIVPDDWEPVTRERPVRTSEPHLPGKQQRAPIWMLRPAMEAMPIDPETYDRWVRVGMALHHATDGSIEGLELWDQWSRKGRKYDGSTRTKWETFR